MFVKPVGRIPQIRHYQVPVAVINGALPAVTAPALINGSGPGVESGTGLSAAARRRQ
ncbi:MAG: hypothetical protein WCI74_14390 [Actinomycetes bacterium]